MPEARRKSIITAILRAISWLVVARISSSNHLSSRGMAHWRIKSSFCRRAQGRIFRVALRVSCIKGSRIRAGRIVSRIYTLRVIFSCSLKANFWGKMLMWELEASALEMVEVADMVASRAFNTIT